MASNWWRRGARIVVRLCVLSFTGCVLLPVCGLAQTKPSVPGKASPQATVNAQAQAAQQALITQARQAYYNLPNEGMASFQCTLTPNWDLLLQDARKSNPANANAAIAVLSQVHFSVVVGADGKAKITHNELTGQSQQMMTALAQIYGGMEQMTSGFFETWSLFMINSPFPAVNSEYQLDTLDSQYRLSYKEGAANVVTNMDHDFAISSMNVTTADFDSTIQPAFLKTPKGYVLNSYGALYQSKNPGENTVLKVTLDYQPVEGLQMLQKLSLSGSYGGTNFAVEVAFSNCQVTKKAAGN